MADGEGGCGHCFVFMKLSGSEKEGGVSAGHGTGDSCLNLVLVVSSHGLPWQLEMFSAATIL